MGRGDALVVELLHEAFPVLGRQQRQDGGHLVGPHVGPDAPPVRYVLRVDAIPPRHGFVRMVGGAASRLRVGEQRLVVRLRTLEGIGADDIFTRPIHRAVAPSRRRRWIGPDASVRDSDAGAAAAHVGDLPGAVAPPVARVHPEVPVQVEVPAREEIRFQGLDTLGRASVPFRSVAVAADILRRMQRLEGRATQARDMRWIELGRRRRHCSGHEGQRGCQYCGIPVNSGHGDAGRALDTQTLSFRCRSVNGGRRIQVRRNRLMRG